MHSGETRVHITTKYHVVHTLDETVRHLKEITLKEAILEFFNIEDNPKNIALAIQTSPHPIDEKILREFIVANGYSSKSIEIGPRTYNQRTAEKLVDAIIASGVIRRSEEITTQDVLDAIALRAVKAVYNCESHQGPTVIHVGIGTLESLDLQEMSEEQLRRN